jgi:hypothetical protein
MLRQASATMKVSSDDGASPLSRNAAKMHCEAE